MFTGLVQTTGTVASIDGGRLELETDDAARAVGGGLRGRERRLPHGHGDRRRASFGADVMEETLRRTALGDLAPGDAVNLELRCGRGTTSAATSCRATSTARAPWRRWPRRASRGSSGSPRPTSLLRYVVEKGSVAVDGVSLTVAEVDGEGFAVSLIPETLERTTLGTAASRAAR